MHRGVTGRDHVKPQRLLVGPLRYGLPVKEVAGVTTAIDQAATLHRQAAATVVAAGELLASPRPAPPTPVVPQELTARLRAAAAVLAPDWLGVDLTDVDDDADIGTGAAARFVRVGIAHAAGASFPVIVPLVGEAHLTFDTDARDPRVAGVLPSLMLRVLATGAPGTVLLRTVDGLGGALFAPFARLADTGVIAPPITDLAGLRAALAEAEQWIAPAGRRGGARDRIVVVTVAAFPAGTTWADLDRLRAIAEQGPEAGLHLIVAGWPGGPDVPPLPRSTAVTLPDAAARVGDPPGALFGIPDDADQPGARTGGLNAPVILDPAPPTTLISRVCAALVIEPDTAAPRLSDQLPAEQWQSDGTDGLSTTVGAAGDRTLELRLNDATPHWLLGGRPGSGRTAFLVNVVHGLAARYSPDDLALHLLDCTPGGAAAELAPTDGGWLPHARVVGVNADPEYGLAVLTNLVTELERREAAATAAGVDRFAALRASDPGTPLPRIVCVIDDFPRLLTSDPAVGGPVRRLLEELTRRGRSQGIHLILAGAGLHDLPGITGTRDPIGGQIPVRIALPGGGEVLDPSNDAAAGLALGTAVVNTAGGFGGPRGATRGHERTVRFPDPYAQRGALATLRHRWHTERPAHTTPAIVFDGTAVPRLADDPTFRAALAGQLARPAILLGHTVGLPRTTAAFPLDATAGSHLAIIAPTGEGARLLVVGAQSLASPQRPTRFVLCEEDIESVAAADELATALQHSGQRVIRVDGAELVAAAEEPGYLIIFGMDALLDAGRLGTDATRELLSGGPARGVHLISWWRSGRRLNDLLGARGRDLLSGLVCYDVPGIDMAALTGHPLDWKHRPGRALLYDRRTDKAQVFVPFATGGEE